MDESSERDETARAAPERSAKVVKSHERGRLVRLLEEAGRKEDLEKAIKGTSEQAGPNHAN